MVLEGCGTHCLGGAGRARGDNGGTSRGFLGWRSSCRVMLPGGHCERGGGLGVAQSKSCNSF